MLWQIYSFVFTNNSQYLSHLCIRVIQMQEKADEVCVNLLKEVVL